MDTFNFDRFRQTLRWYLRVSLRRLTAWAAGSVACVFLGEMGFVWLNRSAGPRSTLLAFSTIFSFLIVIAVLIAFSTGLSWTNDRRRRTALLVLPASNLEKFLAVMVEVGVVRVGAIFLAFVVGDSLRAGACALLWPHYTMAVQEVEGVWTNYYWWDSAVPGLLQHLLPFLFHHVWWPPAVFLVLLAVFLLSLYLLCGTLLRKYAFAVTTLALLLTLMGTAHVLQLVGVEDFSFFSYSDATHAEPYISPYAYAGYVAMPLLTALNCWAAFRIFKGFQIVTNQWTNHDIIKR